MPRNKTQSTSREIRNATASGWGLGLEISLSQLPECCLFEFRFHQQAQELKVFFLQLAKALGFLAAHGTIEILPPMELCRANPYPATGPSNELSGWLGCNVFLQLASNLTGCVS